MRKKTIRLCIAFLCVVVPLSASLFFFLTASTWFFIADPVPPRLDVIFTFSGENARVTYSRELTEKFPQARWVLSDYYHLYSRILSREKFDMSRITAIDTCRYTLSEVRGLADWLNVNRNRLAPTCHSADTAGPSLPGMPQKIEIGLVSNPCHMRRIKCMVADVFSDTTVRFHYLPVPPERYGWTRQEMRRWWTSKKLRTWVGFEVVKLIKYWLFS
jgi:hypothetical protein